MQKSMQNYESDFFRFQSFAAFVASKRDSSRQEGTYWCCCSQTFMDHSAIHKHVARMHHSEIQQLMTATYEHLLKRIEEDSEGQQLMELKVESVDISAWIPETGHISEQQLHQYLSESSLSPRSFNCFEVIQLNLLHCFSFRGPGKVLLYYHYGHVEDPNVMCLWQKALCEKLHLTGKVDHFSPSKRACFCMFQNVCDVFDPSQVRVATEGINGTVGGTDVATQLYIEAMCSHPVFRMDKEDFKVCQRKTKLLRW